MEALVELETATDAVLCSHRARAFNCLPKVHQHIMDLRICDLGAARRRHFLQERGETVLVTGGRDERKSQLRMDIPSEA